MTWLAHCRGTHVCHMCMCASGVGNLNIISGRWPRVITAGCKNALLPIIMPWLLGGHPATPLAWWCRRAACVAAYGWHAYTRADTGLCQAGGAGACCCGARNSVQYSSCTHSAAVQGRAAGRRGRGAFVRRLVRRAARIPSLRFAPALSRAASGRTEQHDAPARPAGVAPDHVSAPTTRNPPRPAGLQERWACSACQVLLVCPPPGLCSVAWIGTPPSAITHIFAMMIRDKPV